MPGSSGNKDPQAQLSFLFPLRPCSLLYLLVCLSSQPRLLFTGAVSYLLVGRNAVYKTNITFGPKPMWNNVGSLCLRDTVPSSQLPEVPCPSPLSQTFSTRLENLAAPHVSCSSLQNSFVSDPLRGTKSSQPSRCDSLSSPPSRCQRPYIACGTEHSNSASSLTSAPAAPCLTPYTSFLIAPHRHQVGSPSPSRASQSPRFCWSLPYYPLCQEANQDTTPHTLYFCPVLSSSLLYCRPDFVVVD